MVRCLISGAPEYTNSHSVACHAESPVDRLLPLLDYAEPYVRGWAIQLFGETDKNFLFPSVWRKGPNQHCAFKGIAPPGEPTEIGVWVNGNSSWGRVIFELQDASGQTWTSIGALQRGELSPWLLDWMPKEALENTKALTQADWNTDGVFSGRWIDFDGWRYVGIPLPGNYPGEEYR